ncbi:glutaredoxin [Sparassis latifolia]|uniref:Monothiol glutaredoxin-5, mitochondrial n=1 Tax=Sparassis crispa TaxID=139825 RepID=A0A401GVY9_9APHY|nr:Monothiol glutaredoxin-5 [Sparassis crispa]GBE86353.1 Monothiol glutaredoxin-5 [Sparassis crispa]
MFRAAFRSPFSPLRTSVATLGSPSLSVARRLLSQEARAKIQDAVHITPVVLFMKGTPDAPQCGFSRAAIQVLDLQGVPTEKLKTFNVLEDSELRSGIKEFSDWPTIPQLYVNGEFVGGCDILLSMHQSGELEQLLEKSGVVPPVVEEPQASTPQSS